VIYSLSNMSSLVEIAQTVGRVFDTALVLFGGHEQWKGRAGSYFCLADPKWGNPFAVLAVGDVPYEKYEKYLALSIEKAGRLARHLGEHFSSWQSRNPQKDHWGGAVKGNYVYSMSGLPELGDEAVMLVVLRIIQPESGSLCSGIAKLSGNWYYEPLLKAIRQNS